MLISQPSCGSWWWWLFWWTKKNTSNDITRRSSLCPGSHVDIPKFTWRFSVPFQKTWCFAGHPLKYHYSRFLKSGPHSCCMQLLSLFPHNRKNLPQADLLLTLRAVFKDGSEVAVRTTLPIIQAWSTMSMWYLGWWLTASQRRVVYHSQEWHDCLGPGSLFTSILPNIVIGRLDRLSWRLKAESLCLQWPSVGNRHFSNSDHVKSPSTLGRPFIDTVLVMSEKGFRNTWIPTVLMNIWFR